MKNHAVLVSFLILANSSAIGQTGWYAVPNAPVAPRFEDVSFIGKTGWVAENYNIAANGVVIHKTMDGGDTWMIIDTITPSYNFVRSLEFINDSVGFAGMLQNGGITAGIYKTTDGGQTFNYINSPAFVNQAGVCGLAHYGNTIIGVGIYDGQRHFYKSVDTGTTWSVMTLDSQIVSGLVDCHMFNDSIYLICGQGLDNGVNKGIILKTYDGGTTWQKVATSTSLFSWGWKLHFRESGVGTCSIQSSTNYFMTTDSGSTWNEVFVGSCSGVVEEFGGNAFLNDTLGWIADQFFSHCLFETRDGGNTWTPYTFGEAIDRMVVIDSVTMLAVGATIYKYSFDSITTSIFTRAKEKTASMQISPNPADAIVRLDLEINNPTLVHLLLLNNNYQVIKSLEPEVLQPGKYQRQIITENLPSGNYYISMISHIEHSTIKFTVVH